MWRLLLVGVLLLGSWAFGTETKYPDVVVFNTGGSWETHVSFDIGYGTWYFKWKANQSENWSYEYDWNAGCPLGQAVTGGGGGGFHGSFSDANTSVLNQWVGFKNKATTCDAEWNTPDPPVEPVTPPGDEWEEAQCVYHGGSLFCWKENLTGLMDVMWSTPCGGTGYSTNLGPEPFNDAYNDYLVAANAECPVDVPIAPDDPRVACTGMDGVACEATQQDVRYILGKILEQMQQERAAVPPPVSPIDEEQTGEVFEGPTFDRSLGEWGAFDAPEVDDGVLTEIESRIGAAWAALQATAETRYPFGMAGWIPNITVGTSSCVDFDFTLLAVSQPLGWCTSAMYTFLTGAGRAALLFMTTLAFVFAVMRTVAWA